ncbi:hypothetical protein R2601_15782 [Salipiger bermudensis HTCC2601]|uniref:Uncharacterized protein n=1 Tax=Salipiger bermudensis (strain DSM 26914 / JCM 13377 / KCTC 12554 / HTCC2601) TaxID=314265 RepID=Q0FQE5_SALBH|nr:hypothetical protein R2601_15782 [Salipiger bermudensis HTCC2601]
MEAEALVELRDIGLVAAQAIEGFAEDDINAAALGEREEAL